MCPIIAVIGEKDDFTNMLNIINQSDRIKLFSYKTICRDNYSHINYLYNFKTTNFILRYFYKLENFLNYPNIDSEIDGIIVCCSKSYKQIDEQIENIYEQVSAKKVYKLPLFVISKTGSRWQKTVNGTLIQNFTWKYQEIGFIFDSIVKESQSIHKQRIIDNLQKMENIKIDTERQTQLSVQFDEFPNADKINEEGILLLIKRVFENIKTNPQNFKWNFTIPTSDLHYSRIIKEIFSKKGYNCESQYIDNNLTVTVSW